MGGKIISQNNRFDLLFVTNTAVWRGNMCGFSALYGAE